jgi:hypothetical protein
MLVKDGITNYQIQLSTVLEKLTVTLLVKFSPYMETKGSFLYSQQPNTEINKLYCLNKILASTTSLSIWLDDTVETVILKSISPSYDSNCGAAVQKANRN